MVRRQAGGTVVRPAGWGRRLPTPSTVSCPILHDNHHPDCRIGSPEDVSTALVYPETGFIQQDANARSQLGALLERRPYREALCKLDRRAGQHRALSTSHSALSTQHSRSLNCVTCGESPPALAVGREDMTCSAVAERAKGTRHGERPRLQLRFRPSCLRAPAHWAR